MPEVSRFYGIVITMFYDEHNPPHFHVQYGEHRALVNIRDGHIKGSLPRRVLHLTYEWLDLHREELLENWKRMESEQDFKSINPLN